MDYYLSQRSCEGYVFTRICQSLCSQGGATPACIAGGIPACLAAGGSAMGGCAPGGGPAPRGCLLQGCLLLEGACSRGDLLKGGICSRGVPGPGGACSRGVGLWRRQETPPVRILLECILVTISATSDKAE